MRPVDNIVCLWQDERELAKVTLWMSYVGSILDILEAKKCRCLCSVLPGSMFANGPTVCLFVFEIWVGLVEHDKVVLNPDFDSSPSLHERFL